MSNAQTIAREWASRPTDERYLSLPEMLGVADAQRARARIAKPSVRSLRADHTASGDLVLKGNEDAEANLTHWAFTQLCQLAGAPSGYVGRLPAELAADCLTHGFSQASEESATKLLIDAADACRTVRAATGEDYGRIWNRDVIRSLMNHVGDGVTGDWRVPGEFGKDVIVTRKNTTLYMSDRDMFIALADEHNRIEVPNRRDGKTGSLARGIIVSNSEVGARKLRISTLLFDFICCNRQIWGLQSWEEIDLRHTRLAPDKWQDAVLPAIELSLKADLAPMQLQVRAAQRARIGSKDEVIKYLTKHLKLASDVNGAIQAHNEDEGRPIETVWDAVTGTTAYAREQTYQSDRVDLERKAGKMIASL
jgi:hypothetical protein